MDKPDLPTPPPPPSNAISVQLRPHIGMMTNSTGEVIQVEHPQWMVFVRIGDWFHRHVGYLGHHQGGDVACVYEARKIPEAEIEAVEAAISEACGWPTRLLLPPRKPAAGGRAT